MTSPSRNRRSTERSEPRDTAADSLRSLRDGLRRIPVPREGLARVLRANPFDPPLPPDESRRS